jgi:hypothetical protein
MSSDVEIILRESFGYDSIDLDVINERNARGVFRTRYCPDFMTNFVSLAKLMECGIHWNTERNVLYYRADSRRVICKLQQIDDQQAINHVPLDHHFEAFAANQVRQIGRKWKLTTRDPRPPRKGDGILWHKHMGHAGAMALHTLGENALGVELVGPRIVQCQHCSLAKIKRQEP